ncbi:MAG: hypothetical protein H6839_12920 [Planctomycetes bacterium]|nr:hypothetical protein [Planctomycetota bacterium]
MVVSSQMSQRSKVTQSRPANPTLGRGLLLAGVSLMVLFATSLQAQLPENLYYKFNEGTGTSTANAANPGVGNTSSTISGATTWTAPQLGASAMAFNASSMSTGWATNLGTSSWSMEFWLKVTAGQFGYACGDNSANSWRVFTAGAAGTNGITMRGGGLSNVDINGAVDGTWHHVAFVYDSAASTMTAYLDGNQVVQNTAQNANINGSGFYVGGHTASTSSMVGDMDEFRFWSTVRTQAQIQANMSSEISGTAPFLSRPTGSAFNGTFSYAGYKGVALANATVVADDSNTANINITVAAVSAAPGVTAPSSQTGAAVPQTLSWTGTPTAAGTYTYTVVLDDGTTQPSFTITFVITDPAPTLVPASGSAFSGSLSYAGYKSTALANASLVADDLNTANIDVTVTPVSAAPGVTAPSSQTGVAVPLTLTWSGTPSAAGTFTYTVSLNDGTNVSNFTVTIVLTDPAPTLAQASGSSFDATLTLKVVIGQSLSVADLTANDLNTANIDITITPTSPAPGVTAPTSQTAVSVPATLSWTGTPTATGTYTYGVSLFDGTNTTNQTVTIIVSVPAVSLGTQGTGNAFPFNYSTGNGRFQTSYGASELNLPNGTVITEVRVAGSVVSVPQYGNLQCRMGHSTLAVNALTASFDTNYTGSLTTVLGPTNFTPSTLPISGTVQWYVFPLSTPFVYNGTDALLIDWSYDSRSSTGFTISTAAPSGEQARSRIYTGTAGGGATTTTGTAASTGGNYGIQLDVFTPNSVAITAGGGGGAITTPQADIVAMNMKAIAVTTSRAINSLTFTQVGTIADASISSLSLIRDNNGDGVVDAGDTTLGTGTLSGGQVTFSGSPLQTVNDVVSSGPVRMLLAVTIPSTLTAGTTMQFQLTNQSAASWSAGTDITIYPLVSGLAFQRMSGTYTINQTSGDFTSIGAAFDALETFGVSGAVTLSITDSATYVSNSSYSLGLNATFGALAPVVGASSTNTITLKAATGQTPVVQGNATGAGLIGFTGRGAIGIMQSYVIVEGLEVTGGPNFGILIQGNGLSSVGLSPTDNVIRGCRVHDIPSGPGISFFGQNAAYFTNGVIENNFVWACHTTSVPTTAQIQGSTSTAGCIAVRNPASGSGIIRHNTIVHTSSVASTAGMAFSAASTAYALNSVTNNIIVVNSATLPAVWLNSTTHASTVANWNFNYWFATVQCNQATLTPFSTWQSGGRDTNGSNANPQLISTTSPYDLHLSIFSPCINPAVQTSTIAVDIDGDTRPVGSSVDIGADEANFPAQLALFSSTAAAASATTGLATDQWLGTFRALSWNSAQQVNSVTLNQVGTAGNAGFSNLKLWVDANANGTFDAADSVIAGPVSALSGTTVTFTGLPAFATGQQATIFITAQLSLTTTPGTARFQVTAASDVSATPGAVTGTFPLQGAIVNVVNPAPTLTPATGSGFNASRVYSALLNVPLSVATLVANDTNNPTLNVTITPVSAAPGVTAPTNLTGATVPANISWTGTPTSVGAFTYTVVVSDGINSPSFTVTINVANPAPTLTPATGSGFNASLVYTANAGVSLTNAVLSASDANDPTVSVTITPVSAAPGVTAPTNLTGATVPATITWTGTPTTVGTYTYTVVVTDGVSSPSFTVTLNVTNPAPTLTPATGSGFNASRVYAGVTGVALANASLVASDVNDPTISVTITPVSAAPGVTQPGNLTGVSSPATITWTGTPTTVGTYTYTVVVSDGANSPSFTVTINVTNPAPTLNPASGSNFTASRVYTGMTGVALASASLEANDANDATVSFTVTAVNAAPGVTAPTNQSNVSVPFTLTWTGAPTAAGSFTYTVVVTDGFSSPSFTVTINVAFNGVITVANGNPGGAFNYADLGDVFNGLETYGVAGPVSIELYDDGGDFTPTDSYRLGVTGTAFTIVTVAGVSTTNTITIRAASGEAPVINGSGAINTYSGSQSGCMAFRNIGNITIEGLTFTGAVDFGVMWYCSVVNTSDNVTIRQCRFHNISAGSAIFMYGSGTTVAPNNVLIENNMMWNVNGDTSWSGGGGMGVIGARRLGTNFVARHNTILLNSSATNASAFQASGAATPMANVSYNVVYITSSASAVFFLSDGTATPPTVADRNVVFLGGSATMSNFSGYNSWAQWQGAGLDVNGLNTDPLLANIGTGTEDLHLQYNSPALNLAVGSPVTVDIDGESRPQAGGIDSGADEAIVPEIEILQGTTNVTDGGSFAAGNVSTVTGSTITFTINNLGTGNLLLTGGTLVVSAIVTNLDAGSGVTTQPASATIALSGSTTFDVFIDPTVAGSFTLSISIDNNDSNENPFDFTVDGTAFVPNGEAEANTATGSTLSGGTNGPFTIALNPGATLSNVSIELTDPEADNITVTSITLITSAPAGITAPSVPGTPGQPVTLDWTGTAAASNAPGAYTWTVTFEDAVNQTPVSVDVTITINDLTPVHSIASASGGTGTVANPYTAEYTETMGVSSAINLANVSDPNTSQTLTISNIAAGGSNPTGGNGLALTLGGGFLTVAPNSVLASGDVGTFTFDVDVTDGTFTITISVSITVSAVPSFVTVSPITDGEQGLGYSFTFVAQGGTGALSFAVTGGALPPGLGLNVSGMLTGTPTQQGVYNFNVGITDTLSVSANAGFQLTIDPPANGNPTITTTSPLPSGTANRVYTPVTLTATGGTAPYAWSVVGTLPPGMSLSPAGVLDGTPTLKGTYAFSITVQDAAFATDTDAFQITIKADPTSGSGSGGGGGGGGGCVSTTMNAVPWALFAMLCVLLVSVRVRASRK